MNSAYLLAILIPLILSQILRVRLINYLVNPHYSIGLRSGLFMNAICSFLNIITPFRLGEIYRFKFLSTRYQSQPVISCLAILIERLLDAILLITTIFIFSTNNVLRTSIAQLLFIALILTFGTVVMVLRINPIFSTALSQLTRQLILIKRKYVSEILLCAMGIWFLYLVAGFFSCKFLSTNIDTWFRWNTASYRLINFKNHTFQLFQDFNLLFIFSFLLIGLLASVMGHRSNRITELLNGSKPDSSQYAPLTSETRTRFARTVFLESPIENYWRKASNSGTIQNIFNGGSGALVYSLKSNKELVRKVGFGYQKYRLKSQFNFMETFSSLWAFPKVENSVMTDTYFAFDMELINDSTPYYTYLSKLNYDKDRYDACLRLYNFIESGNRTTKLLNSREYHVQLQKLWNIKLTHIVDEIYVRIPVMSINDKLLINGKEYSSLQNIFDILKILALEMDPILEESAPHGDSTLSNLLVVCNNSSIRSIDPNPNQLVRNSSIDHGKVLQSLLLKYEENLLSKSDVVQTRREINFTQLFNDSIENCGRHYLKILEANKGNSISSELMCFTSMLRLMPYRLNHDFHKAPLFLAQTIEFGSSLVEKYTK